MDRHIHLADQHAVLALTPRAVVQHPYALHLVHPHVATMASVLKDETMKAASMEGAYDSVAMHVERLDQELHKYDGMKDQSSVMS